MNPVEDWEWGDRKERWRTLQFLNDLRAGRAYCRRESLALHRPVELYLQVTSGCNLDCYMCSEHDRPLELRRGVGLSSLPPEVFRKVETQLFPYSHTVTIGVGGEPMLSPYFLDYVQRANAANQVVQVMTNGTRLTNERIVERVVRTVTRLQLSIDGATPETYERIRAGARWSQLMKNLGRLRRARRTVVEPELRYLTLCFVLMRSNFRELPDLVRLAARVGAEQVRAQSVIPVNDEGAAEVFEADGELLDVLAEARTLGAREGVALDLPALDDTLAAPSGGSCGIPCHLPTLTLFVNHEGVIAPCPHPAANQSWKMGDLREQDFDEIWNSTLYRNLRAGLARGPAPPICEGCTILHRDRVEGDGLQANGAAIDLATFYRGLDLAPLDGAPAPEPLTRLLRGAPALADELTRDPARRAAYGAVIDRLDLRARRSELRR